MKSRFQSKICRALKIVWLCQFTNASFASYFGMGPKMYKMPFIPIMLESLSTQHEIEIHVIVANEYTNKLHDTTIDGINYHFYPLYKEKETENYNFYINPADIQHRKDSIFDLVNRIKPDLIHAHGACFIEFSPIVLQLIDLYPVVISITGFVRTISRTKVNNQIVMWIEDKILKKGRYFGIRTSEMKSIIEEINPSAKFFNHQYPTPKPLTIKDNHGLNEPIDGIFFARLARDKGIYDLFEAIKLVSEEYPNSKFQIIGSAKPEKMKKLYEYSTQLGIQHNVQFLGFIADHQEIYSLAYHAKFCVLPTHHDTVPGTIIESMWMKLPVISYAVGGIPELNTPNKCIELVQPLNILDLSKQMIYLMNHASERKALAESAYRYAQNHYHFDQTKDELIEMYGKVLADYR